MNSVLLEAEVPVITLEDLAVVPKPLLALLIIAIVVLILAVVNAFRMKRARKKHKINVLDALKQRRAAFSVNIQHICGLSIAQGVSTDCYWCNDKVLFEANGASFNLPLYKITDISIKTDVEIQKQYVSSIGGAIAGAAVFGTLGAIIGGSPKEKTTRQIKKYLIFTYCDYDELKYIALDCTYQAKQANQFVDAFQNIKPTETKSFDL